MLLDHNDSCVIPTSCSCRRPPPSVLLLPQVEALHTLMLHRMDDDNFVLATTAAAARLLAQVGLGVRCSGGDMHVGGVKWGEAIITRRYDGTQHLLVPRRLWRCSHNSNCHSLTPVQPTCSRAARHTCRPAGTSRGCGALCRAAAAPGERGTCSAGRQCLCVHCSGSSAAGPDPRSSEALL